MSPGEGSPIAWARAEAERLHELSKGSLGQRASAVTAQARQFLADHAGGSTFEVAASRTHVSPGAGENSIQLLTVAFQLREWATYEESGVSHQKPFEVRFRIEAATDIMEQVQELLKDHGVYPAAPVVLAGAALEMFLRSMQVDSGQPIAGKPSISSYADALRKVELITRGDVKNITAWADDRNEAARISTTCPANEH
jgi:hypothetical protein